MTDALRIRINRTLSALSWLAMDEELPTGILAQIQELREELNEVIRNDG